MPLDLKTLGIGTIANASSLSSSHLLYKPTTSAPAQTAIVHCMRFTNVSSGAAKLQLFFLKSGGTIGGGSPDERRLMPKDLSIAVGNTVIDDDQLTLGSGDGIYAFSDTTSAIDFVISGSERPA